MSVPNKLKGIPMEMTERLSWDQYFILQAMLAAAKSKDDSTWIGVVLVRDNSVIATGFNGFPRGVRELALESWDAHGLDVGPSISGTLDAERWDQRPEKYRWVEHGERNAIYQAARLGHSTLGTTMYANFTGVPCSDCTRAIIQAGVKEIVTRDTAHSEVGVGNGVHYHCGDIEETMLHEAGVTWRKVPDFAPEYRNNSRTTTQECPF